MDSKRGRRGRSRNRGGAAKRSRAVVSAAFRREHGFVPRTTSHRLHPFKDTKIIQFKILIAHILGTKPTSPPVEIYTNVSSILDNLSLTLAEMKITLLKAYIQSPLSSIADPPVLYFKGELDALGEKFGQEFYAECTRDFNSQLLTASIRPPQDDWLPKTSQVGIAQLSNVADVRLEATVMIKLTVPHCTMKTVARALPNRSLQTPSTEDIHDEIGIPLSDFHIVEE